jgi:arabinofuranosyltransferase
VLVPLVIVLTGAWAYRWVQEDAFINFRIIANMAAGHGPVFNVGERVEVYSDPLWLFLLAGLHAALPWLSLEWISVVLGLMGTAAGVVLGGRGVQRLISGRDGGVTLPIGLLIFSVVAGVWEFATSGLEMGLTFCWIGLGFWLLVRTDRLKTSATWCAFVLGLGTLIRPELILMSIVDLVALAIVVKSAGWRGPTSPGRRYLVPLAAAIALPVLYEIWRMTYFALVVANTALAKSAASSRWSQGFTYAWNFVAPYALWIPLALAIPLVAVRISHWWTRHDRLGVVVLATPLVAAIVDLLYVARVGGDYQHARLLLPGFMALCLPLSVGTKQLRTLVVIPVVGIVIWSVACGGWLRFSTGGFYRSDHGITDERTIWITATSSPHPVVAADYHNQLGAYLRRQAAKDKARSKQVLIAESILVSGVPHQPVDLQPASTALPVSLVVALGAIGVTGYLAGPNVYVFDQFSLANPIGSHFQVAARGRPGHEKYIGTDWLFARFGAPTAVLPAGVSARSVAAARKALGCAPLSTYLRAITSPWGFSRAVSDFAHALTYSTMTFSSQPITAESELCR